MIFFFHLYHYIPICIILLQHSSILMCAHDLMSRDMDVHLFPSLCLANNINVEEVRPVALRLECFGVLGGKEFQSEPSAVQHRHQCL